jgi:hypothetical protein
LLPDPGRVTVDHAATVAAICPTRKGISA